MPAWSTCGLQAEDSFPCGQRDPLRVPVDLEAVDRVAALDLGLPGRVPARRTDQVDAVVLAAAHQQLGVDVGRVGQVLGRDQALAGQGRVDRGGAPGLVHGGAGRHRVRDQVDRVVVASLGEVDDVPDPGGARAGAVARLGVVRGLDRLRRRRGRLVLGPEPHAAAGGRPALAHEVAGPDLAQDRDPSAAPAAPRAWRARRAGRAARTRPRRRCARRPRARPRSAAGARPRPGGRSARTRPSGRRRAASPARRWRARSGPRAGSRRPARGG